MGCGVGGVSGVGPGETYSDDWEWFDPFQLTIEEVDDLPEHWEKIMKNMNRECWREGYRYCHAPTDLLCSYPNVPVRGIFVVTRRDATPETVTALDLIHTGGQFVEYDTKDKHIWEEELNELQVSG